ncbi:MAG: permease-like cell division protein FtsX [Clostridia bacterium]|nr:permease-like cell division protein FtsX [Clostridia bacterium]
MFRNFRLGFFLRQAVEGIFRNGMMSLASVAVLCSCLVLMGSFSLVSYNITYNINAIQSVNEIVLFLDPELTDDDITEVASSLRKIENVQAVTFVSKDEALRQYRESLGEDGAILDGLEDDNPIKHSYHITLKDMKLFDQTVYSVGQIDGIVKVRDRRDFVQSLTQTQNIVGLICTWFLVILGTVSLFIVANTIKLTINARRHEIEIMRYVGATNWFIRWPFVIEGVLLGAFAALVAFSIEWYIYIYIFDKVVNQGEILQLLPWDRVAASIGWIFGGISIALGSLGGLISIRKYLKA